MQLIRARKSLGQNFLIDQNIARKIAALMAPAASVPIIEIGPGLGMLTQFLSTLPCPLVVIDIDSRCVEVLRQKFKNQPRMTIVQGDFIETDLDVMLSGPMRWVGNLPYNISSAILFKMLEHRSRVSMAAFMLQKEVAERITAPHGNKAYGILSVLLQTFFKTKLEFAVARHVFRPSPKVSSAVVTFAPVELQMGCSMLDYQSLVKVGFNQRRKKLSNALRTIIRDRDLSAIEFNFDRRAEEVSVEEWITLSEHLFPAKSLT